VNKIWRGWSRWSYCSCKFRPNVAKVLVKSVSYIFLL